MTGPLIHRTRSSKGGNNGLVLKVAVPLKSRLRSFHGSKKSAQEKQKQSEYLESRSPSHTSAYTSECTRDEPEDVVLHTPTARRLDELSTQPFSFDKRRRHRIMSFSRNSSSKRQAQVRAPHQSRKCMKKLPPALSGCGVTINSPWVAPCAQAYYPPDFQCYHPTSEMRDDNRMDIIQTISTDETDLPPAISPAYKFVTIEMAEQMEAMEALEEFSSFSSSDYDICSDEYMASHQEVVTTEKSQKKDKKKKQKGYNQNVDKYSVHIDKYSMHESHSPSSSNCGMWRSLQEGIIYSQCCHGSEID
mmetsp:Transcript_28255/g.40371  ORF Transcript_28255/g.40371 Transcript_28255/m.40371 type:complete len:304 (-) Transcript_28255:61-972(-)